MLFKCGVVRDGQIAQHDAERIRRSEEVVGADVGRGEGLNLGDHLFLSLRLHLPAAMEIEMVEHHRHALSEGGYRLPSLVSQYEMLEEENIAAQPPAQPPLMTWTRAIYIRVLVIMIVDFNLQYPSGTAAGHLINNLHMPTADRQTKFYLELSAAYIGIGMMCPHITNISQLVGGILAAVILYPFLETKKGHWYPSELEPSSIYGLEGYKVLIAIATILGDGLYHLCKMVGCTCFGVYDRFCKRNRGPLSNQDACRQEVFKINFFGMTRCLTGLVYSGFALLVGAVIPYFKWYQVAAILFVIAPTLAFCNAYVRGQSDWSLAPTFGRVAIIAFSAWTTASHADGGGVLAGLTACGIVTNVVFTGSDLVQEYKIAYMTSVSPDKILASQFVGIIMGCVLSPSIYWIFMKGFKDIGIPESTHPAPYALIYRSMSILGTQGFSHLPEYCHVFSFGFFLGAIVLNLLKDILERYNKKCAKFFPGPMPLAIGILTRAIAVAPDSITSNFVLDMCFGSLVMFIWQKIDKPKAGTFGLVVASGLICGEGLWAITTSILALSGIKAPVCMKVLSREEMKKLGTV
ncbi:hypothetical protein Fmac_014360 [Flemingia macrophylla]|uniref:Metal-nicotianamine transporter YSL7 n=1 Tax=Flemingia macrophylla TaxID=520843 RepID=A0ABD1MBH3_9FABA